MKTIVSIVTVAAAVAMLGGAAFAGGQQFAFGGSTSAGATSPGAHSAAFQAAAGGARSSAANISAAQPTGVAAPTAPPVASAPYCCGNSWGPPAGAPAPRNQSAPSPGATAVPDGAWQGCCGQYGYGNGGPAWDGSGWRMMGGGGGMMGWR